MSVAGFFLLLLIAILARVIGSRLIPVLMPKSRVKTVAVGFLGGLAGSLIDRFTIHFGPEVWEINIVAAIIGCVVFVFVLGIYPFVRILVRRA